MIIEVSHHKINCRSLVKILTAHLPIDAKVLFHATKFGRIIETDVFNLLHLEDFDLFEFHKIVIPKISEKDKIAVQQAIDNEKLLELLRR